MRPRGRSTAPMMVRASRRSSQGRPVYVMDVHVDRGCGPGACGTITTSPRTGAVRSVTLVDIPHTTCSSSFVATDGLQQRTSASYRLGRRPTPKRKSSTSDRFRYVLNPSFLTCFLKPRHDHPARSPSAVPAHDGDLFASATAEDPVPGLHRPPVRRVKRLHATTTSPPPTYSHHVIICHNH
jgi:hypothetical protein